LTGDYAGIMVFANRSVGMYLYVYGKKFECVLFYFILFCFILFYFIYLYTGQFSNVNGNVIDNTKNSIIRLNLQTNTWTDVLVQNSEQAILSMCSFFFFF